VTERNATKNATHLEHLLGTSINDALASLLHLFKETHDDVLLDSSFWNDRDECM
jgi:hypothetical protein